MAGEIAYETEHLAGEIMDSEQNNLRVTRACTTDHRCTLRVSMSGVTTIVEHPTAIPAQSLRLTYPPGELARDAFRVRQSHGAGDLPDNLLPIVRVRVCAQNIICRTAGM